MDGKDIALAAARAAADKKAEDVIILDVTKVSSVTDFFVICSGRSAPQVRAISESVCEKLSEAGSRRLRREGTEEAGWILVDFGDAVIHIFDEREREFYKLESLWKDADRVDVQ